MRSICLIVRFICLHETTKVIVGEWMRAITREEEDETNMAKRSTSKNMFGILGSYVSDPVLPYVTDALAYAELAIA